MSLNLGYIFYRNIANTDADFGLTIVDKCKEIKENSKEYFDIEDSIKLIFKTQYPGLTIGLGYDHDSSEVDDFKLGFMFDYTTGLPYIPGSSLKGTIRSVFPANENDKQRLCFINTILGKEYSYEELYEIEKSIFGKNTEDKKSLDNSDTKDTFFDSYFTTSSGNFLVDDYITPHKSEVASPTPLKFLKIAPNIAVTLQIKLAENDKISKEERLRLYKEILEWTGMGAKTNVGYGVAENIKFGYKEFVTTKPKELFEEIGNEKKRILKALKDKENIEKLAKLTPMKRVKTLIEGLENNKEKNKKIFELLEQENQNFNEDEKIKLFEYIKDIIGDKPKKNTPAPKKWAVKIYNFFGE